MTAVSGPTGVPRLIREVFYAPPAPDAAALLFEVALAQHNKGCFEAAVNAYMQAQTAWEEAIFSEHFSDLNDADATSILARLIEQEKRQKEAERERQRERQQVDGDASSHAAAHGSPEGSEGVQSDPHRRRTAEEENVAAAVVGAAEADRAAEAEAEAEAATQEKEREAAAKRQQRIAARHQCFDMLPVEGKIFLRLGVASVFESAGADEQALGELLYAHKLCRTLPSHTTQLLTATVCGCLGGLYVHLSQYDLAADYYFRSLEIREQQLGESHVDVGMVINNVGVVLFFLGRASDAMVMFFRAEAIFAAQLTPAHPRAELCAGNIRRVRGLMLGGSASPPVPYTPVAVPMIPGAKRAKQFFAPKPRKKAAAAAAAGPGKGKK